MPDRFFLTTAIAYANNKPGLHTLHEVIAADAVLIPRDWVQTRVEVLS